MSNAFSSMEYPHWLIIAGALLLILGFFGLASRQRGEADPGDTASEQDPSEPEADLTQAELYERTAREKRRARWADENAAPSSSGTTP
jgi:hypothetical protein